jgi:asparagine N-glycosylation enzyme membrane subunit Stt3
MLLAVAGLAVYAFFLRSLHLLNPDHYYVLSADSYFFHWLAGRVMAGEGPPPDAPSGAIYTLHSGLAYPLAYIAKVISSVFNMPSADALDLVSKFLPPLLGVISIVVIYLAATKICDRRVGLFSAFAWALMFYAVLVGAAGYLDRDGLSILLLMIGAFTFYLSRGWQFRIGNRDIGWLVAGLGVLGIEGILYLEWSFVGPVLLLVVLAVYFVVRFLLGYTDRLQMEPSAMRRLTSAMSEVNWRAFALIALGSIVVASFYHQQAAFLFNLARDAVQTMGKSAIAEMQGIGLGDILIYGFLLIPIALGLYLAWKKRAEGSIFFACWFLSLLVLSLFARRVLLYATPAACLLSGAGLAFMWDWMKRGGFQPLRKVGVAALLFLLILISTTVAYSLGSNPMRAVHEDWQDALIYLRENTPQESVIMTQWSWGYWILDLGNLDMGKRRPLVDNGYYGYDLDKLHDIGMAYSTAEPSEAAQIMEKYGADYLIFYTLDLDFAAHILWWAGLDEEYDEFPDDSLVVRSLAGDFQSEGGLEVVYRSAPNSEVVILKLTQPGQP